MVPYRLGLNHDVLGARYGGAVVMCSFALLGRMGCGWMKMLILIRGKELGGQRYSY